MEDNLTYEAAMARLEQVVSALESGSRSLEEMLVLFEEGNKLATFCSKKLTEYEGKLSKIALDVSGNEEDE